MGLPLDLLADLGAVLIKHGINSLHTDEWNTLILALGPAIERRDADAEARFGNG